MRLESIIGYLVLAILFAGSMSYESNFAAFIDIPSAIIVFIASGGLILAAGQMRPTNPIPWFYVILAGVGLLIIGLFFIVVFIGILPQEPGNKAIMLWFQILIITVIITVILILFMYWTACVVGKNFYGVSGTVIFPLTALIGTVIGIVIMLNTIRDPSSIGPAMAVCILTLFYGLLGMSLITIPIEDKHRLQTRHFEVPILNRLAWFGYPLLSFAVILIAYMILLYSLGTITVTPD